MNKVSSYPTSLQARGSTKYTIVHDASQVTYCTDYSFIDPTRSVCDSYAEALAAVLLFFALKYKHNVNCIALHLYCIGFLFSPPLHVWKTGCFRVAAPLCLAARLRKRAFPILTPPYITFLSRVAYNFTSTNFCLNRKTLFQV